MLTIQRKHQFGMIGLLSAALFVGCSSETSESTASNATPVANDATPAAVESAADSAADMVATAATDSVANTLRPARGASPSNNTPEKASPLTVDRTLSTTPNSNAAPTTISVTPTLLDLGDIATGDTGGGAVVIKNNGTEPVTIERVKCSCGCTSARLAPNTVLASGEEVEMEVRLKGGTRAALLTKTCRFIVKDQQPVIMTVRGNAVSFVESTPKDLDPNVNSDGKLVFAAADGEPFRITSMNPAVITDFPQDPQTEVVINFPYEEWRSLGAQPKVIFYTDHPKCETVYVGVKRTAEDVERIREQQRERQRKLVSDNDERRNKARDDQANKPNNAVVLETRVRRGEVEGLMNDIASGTINVEAQNATGMSMLSMASKYGQVELILGLLDAGADLESTNRNGHTPLMQAAQSKNVEAVQVLLDAGANVEAVDRLNGTAMSMAATYGSPDIVQELLDAGARADVVQDFTGFTPLIWAAIAGDPGVVPLLVDAGANLEHGDLLEGATPLIHAARTGKIQTVRNLVAAGASLEAQDRNGKTPFLSAVTGAASTVEKLQVLIELGADPYATDNRGLTALDFAQRRTDARAADVTAYVESLMAEKGE
ncbi:MAG: ankyrin repeat domain-containing protein [Planctomycetota bacterium]